MSRMKLMLSSNLDKSEELKAHFRHLSLANRMEYAAKKAGLFLGIAVACVFVPVFHFVLVPLFLLITIVAFFKVMGVRRGLVVESKAVCLSCGQPLVFPDRVADDLRIKCKACDAQMLLSEA